MFVPAKVPPSRYLFPVARTGPACYPGTALSPGEAVSVTL